MTAQTELPKYQCHKQVYALKIKELNVLDEDGKIELVPEEEGYESIVLDAKYMERHNPIAGGYYVEYDDGYISYSPQAPFEAGYTLTQ